MDKPLSQERLSEEEIEFVLGLVEYDLEEGHLISWGHAHTMYMEIKRLQAIEAAHNRYKRALRKVICLNVPMPDEVFNLVNDALEGVESHEA
jgi:hypothetical protein